MKSNKVKISALVIFITSISIILGIVACKAQSKPVLPIEPLLTQVSSARPSSPTFPPQSVAVFENLFGNSACSWPCWQGITPGITTISEALQKLQDSPLIPTKYAIQSNGSKTGLGTAKWLWYIDDKCIKEYGYDKRLEEYGYMDWNDGIVRRITLNAYPNISIGEIIKKFGPPEKIGVIDCSDSPDGLQFWCGSLFYTKNGFEIDVMWNYDSENIQITPSDPIDSVVLFRPSVFTPSNIEGWLSPESIEHKRPVKGSPFDWKGFRDWDGYGNLFDLYIR
jgi:hypothetical protein